MEQYIMLDLINYLLTDKELKCLLAIIPIVFIYRYRNKILSFAIYSFFSLFVGVFLILVLVVFLAITDMIIYYLFSVNYSYLLNEILVNIFFYMFIYVLSMYILKKAWVKAMHSKNASFFYFFLKIFYY